jgi:flavorubredoxin
METRIDQIVGGIYRISTMTETYGITFNQFLIDDEQPTLVHTGDHFMYENIRGAIREVLDPARLANLVLLHWEGDENGGMDRFMTEAPGAELVGSALSIQLNAASFGVDTTRVRSFMDGERLELGRHTLRFLETPHVHHWDSMMVYEESTGSVFPSDLYLQPGDQPPVTYENLSAAMIEVYR